MKNTTKISAIALILICIASLGLVSCQSRQPGVIAGDTFKYTFNFEINETSSQLDLSNLFDSLTTIVRDIDWIQVRITQVFGTTVTAQTTIQFKNGTQQSNTQTADVVAGEGELSMFLIAANLGPNDKIYTNADAVINSTETRTYTSGTREVNCQTINMSFTVSQEELADFNITGPLEMSNLQQTYWDKQTGALVEMSYSMVSRSELLNADICLDVELIETSLYAIPEYSGLTYLVIILVASSVALGFAKVNKK
jgi:hypothetical protein